MRVFGETLDADLAEKYCRFASSVVLIDATAQHKSRFITRVFVGDTAYMIAISSYVLEAFKGVHAERVLQIVRELDFETPVSVKKERTHINWSVSKQTLMFVGIGAFSLFVGIVAIFLIATLEPPETPPEPPETTSEPAETTTATTTASEITTTQLIATEPTRTVRTTATTPRNTATSRTATTATTPTTRATSRTSPATTTTPPTVATTAPTVAKIATTPATTTAPQPPVAPSGFRAITNAQGNIELSWDAVAGADGYEIRRSATAVRGFAPISAVITRNGMRLRATDSGVSAGTSYFYAVRAFRNVEGVRIWGEFGEVVSVAVG
jgi:hypothetical protein